VRRREARFTVIFRLSLRPIECHHFTTMKTRFVALLLVALTLPLFLEARPPTGWTDDFDKAVEKAKAEKKNVLLDFTGSDWCGFCIKLDKEVFDTPKFKEWAKKNVVLVQVDFPQSVKLSQKVVKQNAELKAKYPARGYPTIVIINPEGNVLVTKSGYSPGSGPDAYLEGIKAGAVTQ
jgi:protein disulfide-isomerase